MAGNTQADRPAVTGNPGMEGRLGPAEVHHLLRQQLDRLAVLWGLRPSEAYGLTQQMHAHIYAPGEIILPHRVQADFLGLIVRGQVAVYTSQHRAARQLAILLPGSSFGHAGPAGSRPGSAVLQALTRCEIRFLHRADLEALANKRRAERQATRLRVLLVWSVLALFMCLGAALALRLPPVRKAVVLLPMGLGQWCSQQGGEKGRAPWHDRCVEWSWTMAAGLAPSDANVHLALGTFYFERGEVAAAEESFEAARALAPDLAEIYNNLGLIYAKQGIHKVAIDAFERALELEPGTAATEHNLGLSLQALQAHDEALSHYQLALAYDEPQTSTLVNMAIAYYAVGQPRKAAETARQILRNDETVVAAHTVLGAVALESRQPETALAHLHRAIALDEGYSQAYFYLGLAHQALHQPAEAIAALERALATVDEGVTRAQIRRHLKELYEAEEPSPHR